jgi:hypothetical protein
MSSARAAPLRGSAFFIELEAHKRLRSKLRIDFFSGVAAHEKSQADTSAFPGKNRRNAEDRG